MPLTLPKWQQLILKDIVKDKTPKISPRETAHNPMIHVLPFLTLADATALRTTSSEWRLDVAHHPWDECRVAVDCDRFFACFPNAVTLFARQKAPFRIPPSVLNLLFVNTDLDSMEVPQLREFTALCSRIRTIPTPLSLTRLDLGGSYFEADQLRHFAQCPITELLVSGCCQVRAKHLVHFPLCEKFFGRKCILSDEFLKHMPNLSVLDLEHTTGHFAEYPLLLLQEFAAPLLIPDLPFLNLKHFRCSYGAKAVLQSKSVEKLSIDCATVNVLKMPALRDLTLRRTGCEPLRDVDHLEKLTISHGLFQTPVSLCNVEVDHLVLSHCALLADDFMYLKKVKKVTVVCCDVQVFPPCATLEVCGCVAAKHGMKASVECAE